MGIEGKKMNGQVAAQFFNWYCEKKENKVTFFDEKDFKDIVLSDGSKDKVYDTVVDKFKKLDNEKQIKLEFIITHLKV